MKIEKVFFHGKKLLPRERVKSFSFLNIRGNASLGATTVSVEVFLTLAWKVTELLASFGS